MSETLRKHPDFQNHLENANPGDIVLCTNPLLDDIVAGLARHNPDWEGIVSDFKQTQIFQTRRYDGSTLPGTLAEIHLKRYLREWADSTGFVVHNPIPADTPTDNFFLDREAKKGNYRAYRLSDRQTHTEYDELVIIQGLPVLFDIRISRVLGTRSKTHERDSRPTNRLLRKGVISSRFAPLREYFGTRKFGYAVIIPPALINPKSPTQIDFQNRGGKIGAFYTSNRKFKREVREVKEKYNL